MTVDAGRGHVTEVRLVRFSSVTLPFNFPPLLTVLLRRKMLHSGHLEEMGNYAFLSFGRQESLTESWASPPPAGCMPGDTEDNDP